MAKNRCKKKKNGCKKKKNGYSSTDVEDESVCNIPQAMDTTELASGPQILKQKKGRPMKRSKNVRKMKARAKAIAINDKSVEKVSKNESKAKRTQLAKTLYE